MLNDIPTARSVRLSDYRYPGELWSLVITFTLIALVYALLIWIFPNNLSQILKALAFTLAGVAVYVVFVIIQQRAAIGTLVRASPRQFPELYELSTTAAARLSMRPVRVYVIRAAGMNVYPLGLWSKPLIVITSSMVDHLEMEDLQFFIARELSHIQAGHTWLRVLLKPLGSSVAIIGKLLNTMIFGDWINRSELTADRGAFIVCGSLTTSIRAMLKFGVGVKLFNQMDIQEFLDQIQDVSNVSSRITALVAGQPYLTHRVRALTEFALSAKVQQLTQDEHTQTRILKNLPSEFIQSESAKRNLKAPESLLVSVTDNKQFMLHKEHTSIGRSTENDIVIEHSQVSRRHAEIALQGNEFYIADKGSSNGVWLNGKKIHEPARLTDGDRVLIGKLEYVFTQKP